MVNVKKQSGLNRWWRVAGALSMNIALGTLYAWSVFVAPLETQFGWNRADTSLVFTAAVVVFALTFVVAGPYPGSSWAFLLLTCRGHSGKPGILSFRLLDVLCLLHLVFWFHGGYG